MQLGAAAERGAEAPVRLALVCTLLGALAFGRLLWGGLGHEGDLADLLGGPDDFMRMAQAGDWIDGQGWHDLTQRRLNPPWGVAMHWSRLADAPLAAAILVTEPWLGRSEALFAAALVVPPLLGGLFVGFFCWAAAPLTGGRRALPVVLMIPALIIPLQQFHPGRVDHHGLQLLLAVLVVGWLVRVLESGRARIGIGLGAVCGLSLAVGLETLPLVAAVGVALSVAWLLRHIRAEAFAAFGLGLFGAVAMFVLALLPPAEWTVAQCDRLSIAQGALVGLAAAAGACAVLLEQRWPWCGVAPRLAVLGGVGLVGLMSLANQLPLCAIVPYADLPAELRYWFDHVREAQPLFGLLLAKPGVAIGTAALPLVALAFAGVRSLRRDTRNDSRWMALAVLVLGTGAAMAWQIRSAHLAGLAAAVALVPLAVEADRRAQSLATLLGRLSARLCVPIACLALIAGPSWATRALAAETKPSAPSCELAPALTVLNDPAGLGAWRRIVAAPIDLGPAILLLTSHRVLAAPYHRNVRGLTDHRRLYAGSEDEARTVVKTRGIEAILFCRRYERFTRHPDHPGYLNERLAAEEPPAWLTPVMLQDGMGLYRVRPSG